MNQHDFCFGFAAGFLAAGIIGIIAQQIRLASVRAREGVTRQRVYLQTERTPMQAVRRRWLAQLQILLLVLVLAGVLFGVLALLQLLP